MTMKDIGIRIGSIFYLATKLKEILPEILLIKANFWIS